MIIQGMVTDVKPPHDSDQYGNVYQWVTVNTQAGPIIGVKASKKELTQKFIGQNIEWILETANDNNNTYNKFKRPPKPGPYGPQNQTTQYAPPQAQQGVQQAAQQAIPHNNSTITPKDRLIVNQVVYKALIELEVSGELERAEYSTRFEDDVNLILYGKDPRNIPDMDDCEPAF